MQASVKLDGAQSVQRMKEPLTVHWNPIYNIIPWLPWAGLALLGVMKRNRNRALWLLALAPAGWFLGANVNTWMTPLRQYGVGIWDITSTLPEYWLILMAVFFVSANMMTASRKRAVWLLIVAFVAGAAGAYISWTGLIFPQGYLQYTMAAMGRISLYAGLMLAAFGIAVWRTRRRMRKRGTAFSSPRFLLAFVLSLAPLHFLAFLAIHPIYVTRYINSVQEFAGSVGTTVVASVVASIPFVFFALWNKEYRRRLMVLVERPPLKECGTQANVPDPESCCSR